MKDGFLCFFHHVERKSCFEATALLLWNLLLHVICWMVGPKLFLVKKYLQECYWHFQADFGYLAIASSPFFLFLLTFLLFILEVVPYCIYRIFYCILCLGLPSFSSSEKVMLISDQHIFQLKVWRRSFLPQFFLSHQYN